MNKNKILTIALLASLSVTILFTTVWAVNEYILYSPTYDYTSPAAEQGITGEIENSVDGTSWTTANYSGSGTQWFCRLVTTATGYTGSATIDWQLLKSTDQGVTYNQMSGATTSTTATFDGASGQVIYCTADGTASGNYNWAADFDGTAIYKVMKTTTYG